VPTIEDKALVLDHHPFGDRHLILTVLTHRSGVHRGVLRRARSGKAPAAAAAQILSLVHVSLFQRPHAELATYRHLDLVTSSYPLTCELGRTAAAAVVAELLMTFCPPAEPSERAFRLGTTCLEGLLSGIPADTVVAYAQFWMLALGGVLQAGSDIVEAVGETSASILADYRRNNLTKVSGHPSETVCKWLDGQIRAEADRPLRALRFYRQTILSAEEPDD
jgi:hypothetical protein